METDNVLYVPIQLNGNTSYGYDKSQNVSDLIKYGLRDREVYIIKNGVLYVGVTEIVNGKEVVTPMVAQGRVIPNAEIYNPTITGGLKFGDGLVVAEKDLSGVAKSEGRVLFVDTGSTMG